MRARLPHPAVAGSRTGITLLETVIAVSLMTFAAGSLLTAVSSSVQVSTTSLHTAKATGLADQLMDEIASVSFPTSGTAATGSGRTGFNTFDAYNGYSARPPQARSGLAIGTEATSSTTRPLQFQPDPKLMSHYTQQVLVEMIADTGGSSVFDRLSVHDMASCDRHDLLHRCHWGHDSVGGPSSGIQQCCRVSLISVPRR